MNIFDIIKEEYNKINEYFLENNDNEIDDAIQQFVDIIDLDPYNPKMDRYKETLKNKYNYKYIYPETRYKQDTKIVDSLINKKHNKITTKGLKFYFITGKSKDLPRTVKIDIYTINDDFIGKVGFNIDNQKKSITIGGADINKEYRRKGIYSVVVDYIEDVAKKYNLKIVEGSRSSDAKSFWQDRENR